MLARLGVPFALDTAGIGALITGVFFTGLITIATLPASVWRETSSSPTALWLTSYRVWRSSEWWAHRCCSFDRAYAALILLAPSRFATQLHLFGELVPGVRSFCSPGFWHRIAAPSRYALALHPPCLR